MFRNRTSLYNTESKKVIRKEIVELLKNQVKSGNVEIVRDDQFELSNGCPVDVVNAKICKGKRGLKFRLFFNGFILEGKSLSLVNSDYLFIDEQAVDLRRVKIPAHDCISISVDY